MEYSGEYNGEYSGEIFIKSFKAESLIKSRRFKKYRDILEALLVKERDYTFEEAEGLIEEYLKKEMA